jgi:hypothetical protein
MKLSMLTILSVTFGNSVLCFGDWRNNPRNGYRRRHCFPKKVCPSSSSSSWCDISSSSSSCSSSSSYDHCDRPRDICREERKPLCSVKRPLDCKKWNIRKEKKCGNKSKKWPNKCFKRQEYFFCKVNLCEKDPFKICQCYGYETVVVTDENIDHIVCCMRNACIKSAAVAGYNHVDGNFILSDKKVVSPYVPFKNTTIYAVCTKSEI